VNEELSRLVSTLDTTPGAAPHALADMAATLNVQLPDDYVDFMRFSNGAEGSVGESYLVVWPVDEIVDLNQTYRVDDFAPGLVLFGGDGGNTGYAFDKRSAPPRIVEVPLIGMDVNATEYCGASFVEFLRYVARDR
jgi:hypothetical protein